MGYAALSTGHSAPPPEAAQQQDCQRPSERRVDPEDGSEYTYDEFCIAFKSIYSDEEIRQYWFDECQVVPPRGANQGTATHEALLAESFQQLSLDDGGSSSSARAVVDPPVS